MSAKNNDGSSKKPYEAVPLENIEVTLGTLAVPRASAETFDDLETVEAVEERGTDSSAPRAFPVIGNMADNKPILCIVAAVVGIAVLLVMVLVPMSFSGVNYDQMAFRKRRTTGAVDTSHVYSAGLQFIGPDYEFKPFPAGAHFEVLKRVSVFNNDRLEIHLTARFQYFLRPHQLHLLHKKFDVHYRPVLRKNAMDAVKGSATMFSNREMILKRNKMEDALFKSVKERLGGKCCEKDCWKKSKNKCLAGCKPFDTCTEADYGLFADVRYFQLLEVDIPYGLAERYVEALVLQEQNEKEILSQKAVITRKGTDQLVKQTENAASEIAQNARSNATLIGNMAAAQAKSVVESARGDGLKLLYRELGISTTEQKMAFDYLRTLRRQGNAKLAVDYQTYVSGPMAGEL